MPFHIHIATTDEELDACYPVMQELRSQYSLDAFKKQVKLQQQAGYQLAYALYEAPAKDRVDIDVNIGAQTDNSSNSQGSSQTAVVAVAGFIIGHKLAWGKHLYVDDLVTDANSRSTGAGQALINWLTDHAVANECEQFHLDSGVQRFAAHKFYLREGFHIASHHFQRQLNTNH